MNSLGCLTVPLWQRRCAPRPDLCFMGSTEDLEAAVADFEHYDQMETYMAEIVERMRFPQAANQ